MTTQNQNLLRAVIIETGLGEIELEIDLLNAPQTTANFLRYVEEGFYDGGIFYRTVTPHNQPNDQFKIEVIQGGRGIEQLTEGRAKYGPIVLEPTSQTGLRHRDGTLSMGRLTPDSAASEFFICLGDQPELDYGGRRNPDGQGFAAFGRVVRGIEVVRQIQRLPAEGQTLTPPVEIVRMYFPQS